MSSTVDERVPDEPSATRPVDFTADSLRLLLETSLDPSLVVDGNGRIKAWNAHAEATFGWSPTEVIDKPLVDLIIPAASREAHRAGFERYLKTGRGRILNRRVELSARHRDGHELIVELVVMPIRLGESIGFCGFLRDISERARAVAALQRSEQRFRAMADNAPVLIWVRAPDKRCVWLNRRWREFVGQPSEEGLDDPWIAKVHPSDEAAVVEAYADAFEARRPFALEYRLMRHDGSWRWFLDNGAPVYTPDGTFDGYVGSCIDISDLRKSVEAAALSEARYRTLAESLPHLVWTCTPDGWCDYLSRQWVEYTGVPEEQQLGYGWAAQLHPDDRDRARAAWAAATARGGQYDIEFRIRRADGVYRWFKTRAVPLRDLSGRIIKWFGSNTDFQETKEAGQRLETQLARLNLLDRITRGIGERQDLRSIFDVVLTSLEESLPIDFGCVCVHEVGSDVMRVAAVGLRSALAATAIGFSEGAEVTVGPSGLARSLSGHLVYEPDIAGVESGFATALARGGFRSLVLAPLLVESRVFGVLLAARRGPSAFASPDCEFLRQLSEHVALAAHQAHLYQKLQKAYDDLRRSQQTAMQHERLRALGQMAGGVAHNINNAISPVALYTDWLLESEPNLSPRARDYLQTIQQAISDVALTVAGMREFYRQREPELVLGEVSLNAAVQQALDLTRARVSDMPQQRGFVIDVVLSLDDGPCTILGLGSEIREALINLIFNAVDAMPTGGTLTLATRRQSAEPGADGPMIILEVRDTGVGMTEDIRQRCLEPFVTTKGERGTGLGLAMVYGVVQRHGGSIEIQSRPGAGTTVRLSFPEALAGHVGPSSEPTLLGPRGLRMLVIDDDPLLIRSLGDTLMADGHTVVTADTGQRGIQLFAEAHARSEPFALVITDLGMPHVDGRKVASAVKALSPATPVVLLTGWGQRLVAEENVPPHVDQVLSKPPKLRELRAALARLCLRTGALA